MDQRHISYSVGLATGALFAIFLFVGVLIGSKYDFWLLNENIGFERYDKINNISCESYSMGWEYSCGGTAYMKRFNGTVVIGRVYVFNPSWKIESKVIHRAVGCEDDECNVVIFKGDANKVADAPVLKSEILYEVVRMDYKR